MRKPKNGKNKGRESEEKEKKRGSGEEGVPLAVYVLSGQGIKERD